MRPRPDQEGPLNAEFLRDAAMTAAIFGFFASSWFGWAQDSPPIKWRRPLTAGVRISVLIAVAGGVLAMRGTALLAGALYSLGSALLWS